MKKIVIVTSFILLFISCNKDIAEPKQELEKTPEIESVVIKDDKPKSLNYHTVKGEGYSNHGAIKNPGPDVNLFFSSKYKDKSIKNILSEKNNIISLSLDGIAKSIKIEDSSIIWKIRIPSGNYLNPVISDGIITVLSIEGDAVFIDSKTGNFIKHVKYEDGFSYNPIVIGNLVYSANRNGNIVTINNDDLIEVYPTSLSPFKNWILLEDNIYAVDVNNSVVKISLNSLISEEFISLNDEILPVLSGGLGYIMIQNSQFSLYDLDNMELITNINSQATSVPSASIHSGEYVYITRKGRVSLGSLGKEDAIWELELPENIEHKPIISSEAIYFVGKKSLYIVSRTTGEVLNSYKLESDIISSPIVLSDYIIILTLDGITTLSNKESVKAKEPWKTIYKEISLDDEDYYDLPSNGFFLKFSPKESGFYSLISDTMEDYPVEIEILNDIGSSLFVNYGYTSVEKKFTNEFFKGEDYYINIRPMSEESGELHLKLK